VTDVVLAEANLQVGLTVEAAAALPRPATSDRDRHVGNVGSTAALGVVVELRFDPALATVTDPGGGSLDAASGSCAGACRAWTSAPPAASRRGCNGLRAAAARERARLRGPDLVGDARGRSVRRRGFGLGGRGRLRRLVVASSP